MNQSRLDYIWAQCGKAIRLAEVGVAAASGMKDHAVAMAAQFARDASGPDAYAPIQTYLIPLEQKLAPVTAALDRLDIISKSSLEAYLRTLAPELDLSTSTSTPAILDGLADAMTAQAYTIQPSGKLWNYFRNQFGFDGFPTSASPDVDDAIITTTIL